LYVEKANTYSDYRKDLMPWQECLKVLPEYTNEVKIDNNENDFVGTLKNMLNTMAKKLTIIILISQILSSMKMMVDLY